MSSLSILILAPLLLFCFISALVGIWRLRWAYATAAIHDLDGSISGVPDSYIVIDNGIASDEEACEIKPSWGAAVCQGDMGRLSLGGGFGFFRPPGSPAPEPVILSRNGRDFEFRGQTTIRSGAEVTIDTARETLASGTLTRASRATAR